MALLMSKSLQEVHRLLLEQGSWLLSIFANKINNIVDGQGKILKAFRKLRNHSPKSGHWGWGVGGATPGVVAHQARFTPSSEVWMFQYSRVEFSQLSHISVRHDKKDLYHLEGFSSYQTLALSGNPVFSLSLLHLGATLHIITKAPSRLFESLKQINCKKQHSSILQYLGGYSKRLSVWIINHQQSSDSEHTRLKQLDFLGLVTWA